MSTTLDPHPPKPRKGGRVFDFTLFRADRRRACEAIVAFLAARPDPAHVEEIALAVGMARTNIVQRHLQPMADVGLVRCVEPNARGKGHSSSTWTVGNGRPAPATPIARDAVNQARIIAWLEDHDAPATYNEIAEGAGLSEANTRRLVRALAARDAVFRVGVVTPGSGRGVGRSLWLPGPKPEGWTE